MHHRTKLWMSGLAFLLITGMLALTTTGCGPAEDKVFVWCAAGMRPPIKELAEEFEETHGIPIELDYRGSETLLSQIELHQRGDVYIAGDADYIDMADERGFVSTRRALCYFVPVILVQTGNPREITGFDDLLQPGMKLGQGNPEAAAVGRLTMKLLERNEVDAETWEGNVSYVTTTVHELATHVQLQNLDAAIVWDSVARQYEDYSDIVEIPPDRNIIPIVEGAVLTFSSMPDEAQAFLDFLASDRGKEILAKHGYTVEDPR